MASPVKDAKNKHIANGFTEIAGRGRGYLRSRKPGTNQYALTTQVGRVGWHRGKGPYTEADEVDTAWYLAQNNIYRMELGDPYQAEVNLIQSSYRYEDMDTGESVELYAESVLRWTNGTQTQLAAGLSVPTVGVDDDTITFDGLFGAGTSLSIQAQTARLKKLLTIGSLGLLSTPTLSGTVSLSFDLRFQRSAGVTLWVDGVQWDENGAASTSSAVEFRAAGGETLFVFSPVWAEDADGVRQDGELHLRKAGANLFAEVRIPYSWIEAAAFPVVIDPTIDAQVGAGGDDGRAYDGTSDWSSADNQGFIGYHNGTSGTSGIIARFTGISGLAGSTIDATTYFSVYCHSVELGTPLTKIHASDAASPAAPTTYSGYTGITLTTAGVDWDPSGMTSSAFNNSPGIATVIQELVDSYGGVTEILIKHIDDGSASGGNNLILTRSYEQSTSQAAKLHIEYTAGGVTAFPMPSFRPV